MFKNLKNKIVFLISLLLIVSLIIYLLFFSIDNLDYSSIFIEKNKLFDALINTLLISLITLIISTIGGFIFYLLLNCKIPFLRYFVKISREVIIGTPLLVMIFLVVYVFGIQINITNKIVLGIFALSIYMMPYIANTFESVLELIDEKQIIIMELYDFNFFQKYYYIIFPQIIRPLIPSMINHLSNIIKGSALLKIISVYEIAYVITVISNKTYRSIEGYLIMWIMYLIITIPLSLIAKSLAKRYEK